MNTATTVAPVFLSSMELASSARLVLISGKDKTIEDIDVGLFSQNSSNNSDVVRLMTNEIPCGEYRYAQSEVGLWYLEKGVGFTCRVSVPPDSHRFVGQVTVGWAEAPQDIQQVKFMLEIASAMLTKRGN